MKKSILIVVSAMALLLCACGSKNAAPESNGNEGSAQEVKAQENEQQEAAPQKAANDKEFTIRDLYTVTVPDGWKGKNNEINAFVELPNENGQSVVRIAVMICDDMSIDESAQEDGLKLENKIGEEKIGTITWTLFKRQTEDPTDFGAFVAVPSINGCIYAQCFSHQGFNDDLRKGLASIKLK